MAHSSVNTWGGPFRLLVGSFAGLIFLGAAVLAMPFCHAAEPVKLLDCLFTSVSAVCVTGLITVDTATVWSPVGQIVIALLIQLGGMGIMTYSIALLYLAGRQPGMRSRLALRSALGPIPVSELGLMIRNIVLYTATLELVGAALLYWRFSQQFPPLKAAGFALFHAISAFCNAGFALFSDSLMGYAHDPLVNLTVMGLIFLGGIGFLVLRELQQRIFRRNVRHPRMSLSAKMALRTSLVLIVLGTVAIAVLELATDIGPDFDRHPWQFIFCSVTARTAGFNTIDLNLLSNSSILILMLLMFIGASPGSTGGGVKTTVFATIWAMAYSRMRGRPTTEASYRTISENQVSQALALVLISLGAVVVATVLMTSIGTLDPLTGHHRGDFLVLGFEVVSALATVGLSLGATPVLSDGGKVVIILLMFIGRLGPLTLIYALASRTRATGYQLAEEQIVLG